MVYIVEMCGALAPINHASMDRSGTAAVLRRNGVWNGVECRGSKGVERVLWQEEVVGWISCAGV